MAVGALMYSYAAIGDASSSWSLDEPRVGPEAVRPSAWDVERVRIDVSALFDGERRMGLALEVKLHLSRTPARGASYRRSFGGLRRGQGR
ncbi:unnamed protein product [Linum trigynum]|uniref:Uncharacterized protein n=1 Tax=Linum trigynum TaxID=586398 RepID=A0AAV2DIQ1_9ROSI